MENADDPFARLGKPDVTFRPSPGQTEAGLFVACLTVVGGFSVAASGAGFELLTRAFAAAVGVGGLALGRWVYRLRKWRLSLCPLGVVQTWASGAESIKWSDVREVVETRLGGGATEGTITIQTGGKAEPRKETVGGTLTKVTLRGAKQELEVSPVNHARRKRIFRTVLDEARNRNIPIRTEWVSSD